MTNKTSLDRNNIVAFVPTVDAVRAKRFYRDTLGLTLVQEEMPFALVFDANGTMLRVSIVGELSPQPWTILGWEVSDINNLVRRLESAGARFERYGQLEQNEHGVWKSPNGAKVAWFKDPDGNVLSLSEFEEKRR